MFVQVKVHGFQQAESTSASSVQNSTNTGYCMHQTQALCEQSRVERVSALDTDSGKPSSSATTHPSSLLESSSINNWEQPGTSTNRRGTLKCGLFLESPTYLVPSRLVSMSLCERHSNQSNTIGSIGCMELYEIE
ncbi:hypothetical protein FGIG_05310 [Fasciola gigantica]|uniref:Uncharacterized protein n=1 Tax=Fasciola gigantica TaxID=46835 RepID=A0A504Z3I7_FASGI|nr:hypothetical protein FGIG_05310 [Fasciola gigantica]